MIYPLQRLRQLSALATAQRVRAKKLLRHVRRSRFAMREEVADEQRACNNEILPAGRWFPASAGRPNANLVSHGLQHDLRSRCSFWAKAGAPKQVLRWINRGVPLPFQSEPQPYHHHNPTWHPAELQYWQDVLLPKCL